MKLLEDPSIELWEKVVRSCNHATFFHTPTWARIIEKSLPKHRIFTRAYSFDDGAHAVVPLMMVGDGRTRTCRSMALGVYGGPIADGELSADRIEEIFSDLRRINVRRMDVAGNALCAPDSALVFQPFPDLTRRRSFWYLVLGAMRAGPRKYLMEQSAWKNR